MTSTMNKRERKFIHPAIYYGWKIELRAGESKGYWDGDRLCPVSVGPMCLSLIDRGYLEPLPIGHVTIIRATAKAKALKCFGGMCSHGRIIDDDGNETDKLCPDCENGIKFEVKS
ncbi:hypothetical protein F6X00_25425 (plasmid) [Vibrio vulnificus]|uniref:hypothetical protein n=1 Tax=Vibrio vulnificus TaxID=672 RepID=UPI0015F90874|nr:hypothetical protein [Vibrio vulnificus]MCA0767836.1 hypothetical protein [Vibrio vulnificus]MCJ0823850.1 hypothetical protein [Vibrio vulnificus]QMV39739.1 hypothetical protein F6X00_25425 [Vibrio vulnificus]